MSKQRTMTFKSLMIAALLALSSAAPSLASASEPYLPLVPSNDFFMGVDETNLPAGEYRRYQVEIASETAGVLNALVRSRDPQFDPGFYIFSGSGRYQLASETLQRSAEGLWLRHRLAPGSYVIEVGNRYPVASERAYQMELKFTPVTDEFEPNDDPTQAREAKLNQELITTLFSTEEVGDQDFFKIKVDKPGVLMTYGQSPDGMRPLIEIFNDKNSRLHAQTLNTGIEVASPCQLKPGNYYLRVTDQERLNSENPLRIMLSFDTSGRSL